MLVFCFLILFFFQDINANDLTWARPPSKTTFGFLQTLRPLAEESVVDTILEDADNM